MHHRLGQLYLLDNVVLTHQQSCLSECDQPPVLHSARTEVRQGQKICFSQWLWHLEELFLELQCLPGQSQGNFAFLAASWDRLDSNRFVVVLSLYVVEVADS